MQHGVRETLESYEGGVDLNSCGEGGGEKECRYEPGWCVSRTNTVCLLFNKCNTRWIQATCS